VNTNVSVPAVEFSIERGAVFWNFFPSIVVPLHALPGRGPKARANGPCSNCKKEEARLAVVLRNSRRGTSFSFFPHPCFKCAFTRQIEIEAKKDFRTRGVRFSLVRRPNSKKIQFSFCSNSIFYTFWLDSSILNNGTVWAIGVRKSHFAKETITTIAFAEVKPGRRWR